MEWGFCNVEREWMKLKMSLNCRVSAPNTQMVNMCVGLSLSFARTHAVAIHFQCNVRTQTHTLSNRFYLSNSNGVQKQNAIYIERYFARLDLYFFFQLIIAYYITIMQNTIWFGGYSNGWRGKMNTLYRSRAFISFYAFDFAFLYAKRVCYTHA